MARENNDGKNKMKYCRPNMNSMALNEERCIQ